MTFSRQHRNAGHKASLGWIILAAALLCCGTIAARAQTFQVLHTFTNGGDGSWPYAGLTADNAGDLYGTASRGGSMGCGVVFKLTRSGSNWTLNPIYSFKGPNQNDGCSPQSRVAIGPDGSLFGATYQGGSDDAGTVFKLNPPTSICRSFSCPWTEIVLHSFPDPLDSDGFYPTGDLTFDPTGSIYGTTTSGGSGSPYGCFGLGCGVVYELARSQGLWTETILQQFTGQGDGGVPFSGVVFDNRGNLDGSACEGGPHDYGLIFQLTASTWQENTLYDFSGFNDGVCPATLITEGFDMYGISTNSGAYGYGTLFRLVFSNLTWNFESLYEFTAADGSPSSLTRDGAGNFYGTTHLGGAYGFGSVFKVAFSSGAWRYIDLYDFTGERDGSYPTGQPVVDSAGRIFGTTQGGGSGCSSRGCGVIYEITPP